MERKLLYEDVLAGISSAKWELQERANRLSKQNNRTILHTASEDGSIEQVVYILREFAHKNFLVKVDSNKETALHIAVCNGHIEVVKGLIKAARSLPTPAEEDPRDRINGLEAFVRQANESKNTALHLALINGYTDIAKLLVEADPTYKHYQNSNGESPIYLAAKLRYNEIVKMICEKCDNPTVIGPEGATALHFAILKISQAKKEDESDVVEVIIKAAKRSLINSADRLQAFLRQADNNEDTALHLAVKGNHLDVVKLILDSDPTYPQEDKNKELKTAMYIAAEKGYKDIVELLCQTNSTSGYTTPGPNKRTALHVAILGRHTDCVRCLLRRKGCPLTWADDSGWTPLHWAAHQKFNSILDDIFSIPGYKYVYPDKVTPLFIAAEEGHTSTVSKLIQSLPDSSFVHVNRDGQNMLHIAASKSDKDTVKSILRNCPQDSTRKLLNKKDNDGNTPLHLLVSAGCFVPELIKHKGIENIMTTNNHNYTPLDMLYLKEEEIVEDQLQIKKAFENTQSKQHWNWKCWTWPRRTDEKLNTQESIVPPRTRAKKDALFNKANRTLMQEELKFYRQRTNTQIIVTALITTVTFTVGFTLPGGYYQSGDDDGGLALLSKRAAFNAFMVTDALALALSTTSLFFYFISTIYQDPHRVSRFNLASTVLNIVSVIAMMLTFLTGTYVVLSKSRALAITVCVIICLFFLLVIVLSIQMLCNRRDLKIEKTEV